ncbi:MAG: hypoxanthine phosphoribosyltransferase [Dehalococcoidia bacterium]|nr:hypoxanthine phosphoribosyltransferase [Dehalococcoidia bacterium]
MVIRMELDARASSLAHIWIDAGMQRGHTFVDPVCFPCYRRCVSTLVPPSDKPTVLLSRQEIASAVQRLASEVRRDYFPVLRQAQDDPSTGSGRAAHLPSVPGSTSSPRTVETPPLLVGILRGAFVFMADLVRAMDMPVTVDFVRISTYGSGTRSSSRPRIAQGVLSAIRGQHVLVVEDIVDTGITTRFLLDYLEKNGAASAKLCAMLSKPSRRQVDVTIDYLGFNVPDLFVVGYGLDFAQQYRYLPDICVLKDK